MTAPPTPTPTARPAPPARAASRSRLGRALRSGGLRLLLSVAVAGWLLVRAIDALGGPVGIRERFGLGAGLVMVPVQVVVSVSPVPGEIVAAVNVAIYGAWIGGALCWLGWLGAAFLEYALVLRTVRDFGYAGGPDAGAAAGAGLHKLPRWLRRLPAEHPAFLILTRYLPFGSHVVNVTAGARGVPLGRFAWTSAVALAPSSLLFGAIAAGIAARWW